MNHCGRPECECYKKCCERCRKPTVYRDMYDCGDIFCECHEKPVQVHRPKFLEYLKKYEGYVPAIPAQECEHGVPISSECTSCLQKRVLAAPDAEGWEKACEDFIIKATQGLPPHTEASEDDVDTFLARFKSFVANLLASEREKWGNEFDRREEWVSESAEKTGVWKGAKAERQRIEVAIGELKKVCPQHEPGLDCWGYDEYYNEAIAAVLKVVRGEEIKS